MTDTASSRCLPSDFVGSFQFVHPKDIAEQFRQDRPARPGTMWAFQNEIRPSDLYCYLAARFGMPNGLQNFLRNDHSDNLVHWEWYLKTSLGHITLAGLNFRTDIWITGAVLPDSEQDTLLTQLKQDFAAYGKAMGEIRKHNLEPWIEFVNPYQRLRRSVSQLVAELDSLHLDPETDSLPSVLDSDDREAAAKHWTARAADYSRAVGLSFGIRSMIPVMAESFVNLLYFVLARPSVRNDKALFDGLFRLPMHVRVRSLPYFCASFAQAIDSSHGAVQDYFRLVDTRNDLLHGNIAIEKLKFNEVYFAGTVPVFNQYSTMWERSLGVSHRAVGLSEVHRELAVVNAFIEYLLGLLSEPVRENVRFVSGQFDLGIRKDTGRIGVLFSQRLVDVGVLRGETTDAP